MNKTKIKIQETALDLFSIKGYAAVSIRDICKEVGIKESTIYYHFKNKQDILNSLTKQVDEHATKLKEQFEKDVSMREKLDKETFINDTKNLINAYYLNPFVYKMISLLSIEMLHSQSAYDIYHKIVFDMLEMQLNSVFAKLKEIGLIQSKNIKYITYQYNAMIYYVFQKNCLGVFFNDNQKEIVNKETTDIAKDFYDEYIK